LSGAIRTVSPAALRAARDAVHEGRAELALVDVRDEAEFSGRHLFWAACIPLGRIEMQFPTLVPRRAAPVVLCDADGAAGGPAMRAAALLGRHGYTDVTVLEGGVAGWEAAGHLTYSGINVPSKAFGEFVEHRYGTPSLSAKEVDALLRGAHPPLVVDSRPFGEFSQMSIPTGIDCPGAELVYRVPGLAPDPGRMVIVNCAGRTRSIIGAQSLVNAGLPNHVAALRNGTMGWELDGLKLEHAQSRRAPEPDGAALARAKESAARVARRFGVHTVCMVTLNAWQSEAAHRTLYVLDVRHPEEFEAGHLPGSHSAPGGQLVQATDEYMATLGGRVVLVDDHQVRATMTASWLIQMGWRDVAVLEGGLAGPLEQGTPVRNLLGPATEPESVDAAELSRMLDAGTAVVADLSLSRAYRRGHIPDSWFLMRGRMATDLAHVPFADTLVLTSEDGAQARIAAAEAQSLRLAKVCVLAGGNRAWRAAGLPMDEGTSNMASAPEDVWLRPYERGEGNREAMEGYLTWEVDLIDKLATDDEARFHYFPA
jgi:rhodanese-related sulfurtransferase